MSVRVCISRPKSSERRGPAKAAGESESYVGVHPRQTLNGLPPMKLSQQPAERSRFWNNEFGYGYVGWTIRSNSPAKALYRFYLGEDTQEDYCTLAKFVEDDPTSTADIPLAMVDDRLRERAGVTKSSANVCAIEALNNGFQPTFRTASLLALAAMSLKLFPKGQETADEANKWLGLVDSEGLWIYQDESEDKVIVAGDFEDALPQLLKSYCEM